jgi:hypothetical protein
MNATEGERLCEEDEQCENRINEIEDETHSSCATIQIDLLSYMILPL